MALNVTTIFENRKMWMYYCRLDRHRRSERLHPPYSLFTYFICRAVQPAVRLLVRSVPQVRLVVANINVEVPPLHVIARNSGDFCRSFVAISLFSGRLSILINNQIVTKITSIQYKSAWKL